jgi:hypothetical protein
MSLISSSQHGLRTKYLFFLVSIAMLASAVPALLGQTPTIPSGGGITGKERPSRESSNDPVANHQAVVTFGRARFTVLTSQMIRMEWAADGKFEDHASFIFISRRLPVPPYSKKIACAEGKRGLTLKTENLKLRYFPESAGDGKFNPQNLTVTLVLNGKEVVWHPGLTDTGNLLGTTRTLDEARGSQTKSPIEPGLISRDGWTVVDDSVRPLFNSANFDFSEGERSPWPWVTDRPPGNRQDLYFFGYGHDYRQALSDYVRVAGRKRTSGLS